MSKFEDFIVEIGTEELPLKELQNLSNAFAQNLSTQLSEAGIAIVESHVKVFASPRRLAVLIKDLPLQQPDQLVTRIGPSRKAAFNPDGTLTKAGEGFINSAQVTIAELKFNQDDKLYIEKTVTGQKIIALLPAMVEQSITKLPIKKAMRWGTGEFSFVRPVHCILMLLGKNVVPAKIFGIEASNYTQGHRIHCPKPIKIASPDTYEQQLETEGKVIADFAKRKQLILTAINELAAKEHGTAVIEPELLNMVTGLVEYPVAYLASFNPEFLTVPQECLISSMQDHQKCFALIDNSKNLLPKFILISNLESTDPATVIRGNELVMGARLADAAFYFNKDQQQSLEARVEQLKTVTYQKKLGSLFDKTERITKLAEYIANHLKADKKTVASAAHLCKADLLTNMVYEFPELQGIMGCYYAKHDKLSESVAVAIQEHYQPRFAQDVLPKSAAGICIAIADRIDSLVGMFGIGNIPTGEKDPYALRRQALGVLRILIESHLNLDLKLLFEQAIHNYQGKITDISAELLSFFFDRLKSFYLEKDFAAKTFAAVMANNPTIPLDFDKRIRAVTEFQTLPQAESLAAANKRVQNLLAKNPANKHKIHRELISNAAEKELFSALEHQENAIAPLLKNNDYSAILQSLATLQAPVDKFFTDVMVMDENEALRNNRLNLLQRLRNLFLQVADVSLL